MQNFVIVGKAKNVFRVIKLMAQAESMIQEKKKWGKVPRTPSLN